MKVSENTYNRFFDSINKVWKCLVLLSFGLLVVLNGFSQSNKTFCLKKDGGGTCFNDSLKFEKQLSKTLVILHKKGFVGAYLTKDCSRDTLLIQIEKGKKYSWSEIHFPDSISYLLRKANVKESWFIDRKIDLKTYQASIDKILDYLEQNGYPFASIGLQNLKEVHDGLVGDLQINKGPFITIEDIIIKGTSKVKPHVAGLLVGVRIGDPYNEKRISKSFSMINQNISLIAYQPTQVVFDEDKARVYLFINDRKGSSANGILGLTTNEKTNKTNLTGELDLSLNNLYKLTDQLSLKWRALREQTQDLKVEVSIPFLFKTNFGLTGDFKLYKQDTSFIELNPEIGIAYYLNNSSFVKVFYENSTSNLISVSQFNETTTVLPENANFSSNLFGIGFKYQKVDEMFNPSKGFIANIQASTGFKSLKKISTVNEVLYDSVKMKTSVVKVEADLQAFLPFSRKLTNAFRLNTAILENENLYQNELFRIGGNQLLRGFDEESIYSSSYLSLSYEFRFLFDRFSNTFVFVDAAYVENKANKNFVADLPYGFGVGIRFWSKAGMFMLSYALGSQQGNPILLKTGKIHFGYQARF